MAKRRRKENKKFSFYRFFEDNRTNIIRGFWVFALLLCILFGYTRGYPLVAAGQVWNGVLIGVAWGAGAFFAIAFSFYLNRKLKGL
jgi:hypothetical protein